MAPQRKRKRATSSTGTRRRRKNNSGNSRKLALYAGILILGAAGIVFYNQYPGAVTALSLHPHTTVAAGNKQSSKPAFVEPDYQFYTLLPQGDTATSSTTTPAATVKPLPAATPNHTTATVATNSNSNIATATNENKVVATTATSTATAKNTAPIAAATPLPPVVNHHYRLQLAAFKRYEDADELKAKLILQGYPTTINSANVNGTVWYRLSIGPYGTIQQAKNVQAKLEQTHLVAHTQVVQQ